MKRYPAYKDSGVKWIGKIPRHWSCSKIKYNTYVKGRIGWQGLTTSEYIDEGPFLVTGTDFQKGKIDWSSCYHVSEDRYNQDEFIQIKENDLLITKDGTIGKIALVKGLNGKATLNSGVFVTRPRNGTYANDFMFWILNSKVFDEYIEYIKTGTTISHLYQNTFVEFAYPLPAEDEQKSVVAYLDQKTRLIDTLIEKKQKQLELLKEERTAIINQAVTKGLNPNVKMKDSGIEWLGEIPEHWDRSKLKYVAQVLRGKFSHRPRNDPTLYDGPFPFIQTGDVAKAGKYITGYSQTLNEKGFEVSKEFPKGTLVMTIAANVGDIAILDFDACFPDSIVGFYPNEGMILDYLYYLLGVMRDEFYKISTINTQLNINVDRISFCVCPLPPVAEQNNIAKKLDSKMVKIDLLQSTHQQAIKNLQEYRTTLISEVVTGKIDVRDEAIP